MSDETTPRLVRTWISCRQQLKHAEKSLKRAKAELEVACNKLGVRIAPDDMDVGEEIALWVRLNDKQEQVVVCRKLNNGELCDGGGISYELKTRTARQVRRTDEERVA